MKYCTWCSKDIVPGVKRLDLCLGCNKAYSLKKQYKDLERFNFPHDDPGDVEYKALCHMNTNSLCQDVMEDRIRRMTAELQAGWTNNQEERRSVYKKKDTYPLLRYKSSVTRRGVLYRSI